MAMRVVNRMEHGKKKRNKLFLEVADLVRIFD